MALIDALGTLARFSLLPGRRHDSVGVDLLSEDVDFKALMADTAFDTNALRAELNQRGALAVIPSTANRKTPIPHDIERYQWRHLVENFFAKIKEFRAIATRYDKTDSSSAANWNLVATIFAAK